MQDINEKMRYDNSLWKVTMGELLDAVAEKYPDQPCVLYTDRPYRKTYAEFRDMCNEVAKGLMALGVKKGDHVAIWATNVPEWLMIMWATAKIGAVMVTVNTAYKFFELEYLLKQSDSTTLILIDEYKGSDYLKIMHEVYPEIDQAKPGDAQIENLPYLKNIIHVGPERQKGMFQWEDLYEMAKSVSDEQLAAAQAATDYQDVVNMQYTSGTTGFPKGVMLTHYNVINNGKTIGDGMAFTPEDRLCIPVPFFHCFGCVLAIMASVTHGTTMVPIDIYHPLKVMQALESEQCTACHGVPTMFIAMLEHPDFEKFDFSHMRTGIMAGSPCPVAVMKQVVEKMNMREITIVYGLTEASPGCTMTTTKDSLDIRVNTVGKHFPFVECKVVDPETGEECPPGVQGEFMARGYNIMKGYYKMPEATAQAIEPDGWLHSGDLAVMDENGYFKVTGRIKDMIIRGGENIYPKEIEEFIYTQEAVSDVQVIGVPSEKYGEEIMACIILKEGMTMTEDEVKDLVRANMARHKVPRYVRFVDSFPLTASGKIQKYKMREEAIEYLKLQDIANIETA